jgi:uncharacterized protein YqjF (DUF2071 family)
MASRESADTPDEQGNRDPMSAVRPAPLGRWWLRNRWDNLTFVHWAYDPGIVQALLPDGLTVDTLDGRAYVSLVPFEMRNATPRLLPALPWLSSFAETNVRTYVVDSAGNRAVWFLSLEADRLPIVAFARLTLGFPYVWANLTIEQKDGWRRYETRSRRWPTAPASTTAVAIEIGDEISEPSEIDVFLTARWGAVAQWPRRRGRLRHHPVDHPEWKVREATLCEYHDESFQAAGLPAPTGLPIVRWVETIDARFGPPKRV